MNGIDCVSFVVFEVHLASRVGVPSRREFFSRVEALDDLRDRLYDDYADAAADVSGREAAEFRGAVAELDGAFDREGALMDVSWRGRRYWIEEHHEEGGF